MQDIIGRLRVHAADFRKDSSGRFAAELEEAAEEIAALRRFLQIALDEHDDHFGATNAEKFPKAWDVQAHKRLEAAEKAE